MSFQGKASPNYNETLFNFGHGEGGFPADSDCGRAYVHYVEGMRFEDFLNEISYSAEFEEVWQAAKESVEEYADYDDFKDDEIVLQETIDDEFHEKMLDIALSVYEELGLLDEDGFEKSRK